MKLTSILMKRLVYSCRKWWNDELKVDSNKTFCLRFFHHRSKSNWWFHAFIELRNFFRFFFSLIYLIIQKYGKRKSTMRNNYPINIHGVFEISQRFSNWAAAAMQVSKMYLIIPIMASDFCNFQQWHNRFIDQSLRWSPQSSSQKPKTYPIESNNWPY